MKFNAVIFDLDGTLLNTLGDLRNAVNHALSTFGLPPRTLEEVRAFVGNGVANLIRRAMPAGSSEETLAQALAAFRAYYNAHLNVETVPYPGVISMLKDLKAAGLPVMVNSNKYDAALQELVKCHFPNLYFRAAGESDACPRKPDPTAALTLARAAGAAPEKTLYVGDSAVDVNTARNAGMSCAWVSWGFRSREDMASDLPEAAFDTTQALADYILGR